jgi:hypothetical protein
VKVWIVLWGWEGKKESAQLWLILSLFAKKLEVLNCEKFGILMVNIPLCYVN